MRYSVCVIDDKIPASSMEGIRDFDLLNASNLQLLLQQREELWTDPVIKNLVKTLLEQKDTDGVSPKWDVYGFTNPLFCINALHDGLSRFDIIVFDWEYPGAGSSAGIDSESILKEILEKTFCLVFIFSGADKESEIKAVLAKQEFEEYKERLQYLDKTVSGMDQTITLLEKAEEMSAGNFSFRFASHLRKKSVQCIDQILSDMGRASLNDVKNHIVVGEGGKKDFVDFLAERFRTAMAGKEIYDLLDEIPESALETSTLDEPAPDKPLATLPDKLLAAKIWSYRLYFQREPGDDRVRRGDIVKNGALFYLVLSADCDLGYFWKKNLGIVNAVALHDLDSSNTGLKDLLTLCVKPEKISSKVASLLGRIGELSEGPFVLPFVPVGSGTKDFIAIPKDLFSRRIDRPSAWNSWGEKQKKLDSMKYSYWSDTERVCTVSEPFLTPVIQHVLNNLGGHGVPDYPDHMKDILKKILDDFGATSSTTTTTTT